MDDVIARRPETRLDVYNVYITVAGAGAELGAGQGLGGAVVGVAEFSGGISGEVTVSQEPSNTSTVCLDIYSIYTVYSIYNIYTQVGVSGTLTGLPGGQFALLLVSLSYGGCEDVVETGVMRGRYCTILYCTVLHSTLYCTELYCVLYWAG